MRKLASILFLFVVTSTMAQKLTTEVSKNKVAVGEMFQIQFSLTGSGSNIKMPNMNDFDIYQGPFQSSSTSISNGSITQSTSLTYVIAAKKEGKFTIGPASTNVNGTAVQSNSVVIEVMKGSGNNNSNSNQNSGQSVSPPSTDANNNVLVKAFVNKTKAYVGEELSLTFKLYFRVDLVQLNVKAMPACDGFFMQEVKIGSNQSNETVDGVTYAVTEIKKTFMFPQHSGKLTIDPLEIECVARQRSAKKPRDLFEQLMGGGYENVQMKVKSKPITVDVQALPEANKPSDFSGAVGDFAYKVQLNKDQVKANEAVNLSVTLTGKGNIKLVDAPKTNFPEDFETYDPKINENISVGTNGVSGTKTFDYVLIPRHGGDYKIDNLSFTFFNPAKNEYITIPSPELNIHVEKGNETNTAASVFTPNSKEEVKVLGNDIRYIKTKNIQPKVKDEYFFGSPLFYTGIISPFIAFLFFIFIRRRSIEQNKDLVAVRSRKATKMAKKRLSAAEVNLKQNQKEQFYLEISAALYGYISNKLNVSGADVNKENISAHLKERNVSDVTVAQLMSTLNTCEYARYAPNAVSGDLNSIYSSTVELITKIEHEIV